MKISRPSSWLIALILLLLSGYNLAGVMQVPFHPDESTQLYMSRDIERLLSDPAKLFWDQEKAGDLEQHYRLIDAPLTRYLIGFARQICGLQPLSADWDWSQNWEQNKAAGALPSTQLLMCGRLAITFLIPLSLFLIYKIGTALQGRLLGMIAAVLLGTSALVLLHDRRAMAEGVLTFGICLSLWGILHADQRPILAAIGIAIAFNAKQSALALFPAGLLAVSWLPAENRSPRRLVTNAIQYSLVFALVTLALNPVWWRDPIESIQASWQERQDLLVSQEVATQALAPGQLLTTPFERLVAMIANVYIIDPQFAEVGNYLDQIREASEVYLDKPVNRLLRGNMGGGFLLGASLYGCVLILYRLRSAQSSDHRRMVLLLLAFLFQAGALLITVPLPHQRYIIPLVPFVCLIAGYAASSLCQTLIHRSKSFPAGVNPIDG